MLTKREKNSILHAVCIGDGYLRVPSEFGKTARTPGYKSKNYQLSIQHDIKQLDFLKWKRDLLEECLGKKINIRINERWNHDKTSKRKLCTLTISDTKFNKVYNRLYKGKNKILSKKLLNRIDERGLAIWFGDDGWGGIITGKRYGKVYPNQRYKRIHISTQCFDDNSLKNFIFYLKNKWNINSLAHAEAPNLGKNNKRICIQKQKSSNKFLEVVSPYLRKIKSMEHKLCEI